MRWSLQYDKAHAEEYLTAGMAAHIQGLEMAVRALAETKGTDDLTWLDDLREEAARAAKGTTAEQIPIEVDAGAVRFGFEALDANFQRIRSMLIKEK